jgi:hypothetical protein
MASLPRIVCSLEEPDGQDMVVQPNNMHWIIHWDVNETILVGDEVGGDTTEDCFNKIIAKSAFVRMPCDEAQPLYDYDNTSALKPTHWWDGSRLDAKAASSPSPPLYTGWEWPEGCCPYYRTSFKKLAKDFVQHHGIIYRPVYEEIERRLTTTLQGQSAFKNILPAFFRTMYELVHNREGPPITFVFRTFGVDLPQIARAITDFAQGKHPDYPDFVHPEYELDLGRLYNAKWVPLVDQSSPDKEKQDYYFQYQLYRQDNSDLIASGDQQVLDLLHDTTSGHYVHGIRDDYDMWKSHGWEPWAGKPVWKTDSSNHHHILLDDNIHNLPNDGIASVRRAVTSQREEEDPNEIVFESLSGKEIQAEHGMHLIRVPTIEPILNERWFLQQIQKAQAVALKARGDCEKS